MSTTTIRAASSARFDPESPAWRDSDGTGHWVMRGANFIVAASLADVGAVLHRSAADQVDESMLLLPMGTAAEVEAGGQTISSDGDSLIILPPGESKVTVTRAGWLYRICSSRAADLAAQASNRADYERGVCDVAALQDWPLPADGYRLRHYRLAEHSRAGTTMRLFRCTTLMVNVFLPNRAPRDVRKMTPHSHADFEQGSLALCGEYVHHLRYPWTPDMPGWREDEHGRIGAPSLIVIPPGVVHTSQSIGEPPMQLVDIFAPPRDDFSQKSGLVCNADDYPLPQRLLDAVPAAGAA